jgi:trk system potassium uptake protein TrkH
MVKTDMLPNRNHFQIWKTILYYIGMVVVGLGVLMYLPLTVSVLYAEWAVAVNFALSGSVALFLGGMMVLSFAKYRGQRLGWGEGMTVTAGAWFLGMLVCALPYALSGNYLSYLDCCFDVMSGFTTTGLSLVQDMDHLSNGINTWRHLLTFVGGQGMVVLVLTVLTKGASGAYKMYVGEGKDERLVPNVVHTARYIWYVSLIYLVFGTMCLWVAGIAAGMAADRSLLHGLWIFMSAWSTGGFAPMSQSILYYHNATYELITIVFFVIGSFNFALHYAAFTGNRCELVKNVETISFTVTVTLLTLIVTLGLLQSDVYPNAIAMFRKGFYQLISGHTTTGFMTVYARQFYHEWGDIALFAMVLAMLIGGSACSTAGGFKGIRMGIIFTAFRRDVSRVAMPESMVAIRRYHHIRDVVLDDGVVRSAMLIVIAYIMTFTFATLAGMLCGYPFSMAVFESASATGNVGLSIGLTNAEMPAVLKIVYITVMWMARLEFMSVLALAAYIRMKVKKK